VIHDAVSIVRPGFESGFSIRLMRSWQNCKSAKQTPAMTFEFKFARFALILLRFPAEQSIVGPTDFFIPEEREGGSRCAALPSLPPL
jgi:hypothetical protein